MKRVLVAYANSEGSGEYAHPYNNNNNDKNNDNNNVFILRGEHI